MVVVCKLLHSPTNKELAKILKFRKYISVRGKEVVKTSSPNYIIRHYYHLLLYKECENKTRLVVGILVADVISPSKIPRHFLPIKDYSPQSIVQSGRFSRSKKSHNNWLTLARKYFQNATKVLTRRKAAYIVYCLTMAQHCPLLGQKSAITGAIICHCQAQNDMSGGCKTTTLYFTLHSSPNRLKPR